MLYIVIKLLSILIGISLLFWGVWEAFEGKNKRQIIGAIAAPIGLIMALLGVLLLCVPKFFQ